MWINIEEIKQRERETDKQIDVDKHRSNETKRERDRQTDRQTNKC